MITQKHDLQLGEEIKYQAKVSKAILILPIVVFMLILPISISCIESSLPFIVFPGELFIIVSLIPIVRRIMIIISTQCIVTNKRVIYSTGILRHESLELLLNKCEGVKYNLSLLGRIFGYGNVIVTTGGVTNCFRYINDPNGLRNVINSLV